MKKILQLRVLSCESEFRSAGQWEQWVEYCMYSLTWAKLHFDINDPFYGQMKTWISDEFLCAEKLKEKLPETCLKNLTQLQVWALDPSPQPEGMDQVFNPDLIPKIPELEDRKAKLVAEFDINQWSSTSPFANVTDNLIQNFEKVKDKLRVHFSPQSSPSYFSFRNGSTVSRYSVNKRHQSFTTSVSHVGSISH